MTDWKKVKAVTFDVDGVMTDGGLLAMDGGEFVREFNVKDSFALRYAALCGYRLGVFSGGDPPGVRTRLRVCGIPDEDIHLGCRGKLPVWKAFLAKYGLQPEEVLYMGDDIPDLQVIKAAGIGAVPADAARDAIEAADYVCEAPGGRGALREVIEKMMRGSGAWQFEDDIFTKIF